MENDSKKVVSTCPACGSGQTEFSFKKNGFDLYECRRCRHRFVYPVSYDAHSLYDSDYFVGAKKGSGYVDYDKDKEPMRPAFAEYLKRIEGVVPEKGILLDVGAATGFFMRIAEGRGWKTKGLEISTYATEVARNNGLDVQCGILEDSNFAEQSFDVVSMWDVLEHFADPEASIRAVARLLKKDGILAINTPDGGSLYARLMGNRWHLLVPPEHINYFTKKSITLFLEGNGFSVEKISKIGKSFTLEYILQTMSTWQQSRELQKVTDFLKRHPKVGRISIPINLYDNMFVIARRR